MALPTHPTRRPDRKRAQHDCLPLQPLPCGGPVLLLEEQGDRGDRLTGRDRREGQGGDHCMPALCSPTATLGRALPPGPAVDL
jgi:hypothetical protein